MDIIVKIVFFFVLIFIGKNEMYILNKYVNYFIDLKVFCWSRSIIINVFEKG